MRTCGVLVAAVLAVAVAGCSGVGTMEEVGRRAAAEDRVVVGAFEEAVKADLVRKGEEAAKRNRMMVGSYEMEVSDDLMVVGERPKEMPERVEMLREAKGGYPGEARRKRAMTVCRVWQYNAEYRLVRVSKVARTGDAERPIEAVAEVEVKSFVKEVKWEDPAVPAAPAGFKVMTEADWKKLAEQPGDDVERIVVPIAFADEVNYQWQDAAAVPIPAGEWKGPAVEGAVQVKVVAACRAMAFKETAARYEWRYRWDVAEGKWECMGTKPVEGKGRARD